MATMKAYAVLSGGGVKGAALAGCLDAATHHGIEFAGFGGTSAGSIVALLASVGYDGKKIAGLMKNGQPAHPMAILKDQGQWLREAQAHLENAIDILYSDRSLFFKLRKLRSIHNKAAPIRKQIYNHLGLYDGKVLRKVLMDLVVQQKPELKNHASITFEDLENARCLPLKIVASDITLRKAAPFKRKPPQPSQGGHRIYSQDVFDAVRASAGYPFLFQPEVLADGTRLVDGGLSSNLPTFLFLEEQELTRYPLLAFNLVSSTSPSAKDSALVRFGKDMAASALEASDDLLANLMPNVHLVEVPIPADITTLKFDLSDTDIDRLYNAGYQETSTSLANWNRLKEVKDKEEKRPSGILNLPQQLQVVYGAETLFRFPLRSLIRMIEDHTSARDVRSQVMLPTGLGDGSRIVVYHQGFRPNDPDRDLVLGQYAGCSGRALETRIPAFADLADAKNNYTKWRMSSEQQARVAPDRQSMFSVPIFAWSRERGNVDDLPILGILSVDSSTALVDTGWVSAQDMSIDEGGIFLIMIQWADVISKLLR